MFKALASVFFIQLWDLMLQHDNCINTARVHHHPTLVTVPVDWAEHGLAVLLVMDGLARGTTSPKHIHI